MTEQLLTVGVYGSSEDRFYRCLERANVDALIDIRRRRGARGSQYAFINSKRLQEGLAARHLQYLHLLELAPTAEIRELQKKADKARDESKRARAGLSPEFTLAYESDVLTPSTLRSAADQLRRYERPALLCVEAAPEACHRSLAASHLASILSVPVEHLQP
jgi:uncharacterized protein (DUF488 family)